MAEAPKHLVRTQEIDPAEGYLVRHPLNPNAEIRERSLSEPTGMQRVVVSLARVRPGKESFIEHAHMKDEEFLFVLEGTGTAVIGGVELAVGPGDFMGFPTDGTAHTMRNSGAVDLVYLMGGERSPIEVVRFPTAGKVGVFSAAQGGATLYDESTSRDFAFADFVAEE